MSLAVPNSALPSRKLWTGVAALAGMIVALVLLSWYLDLTPSSFEVDGSFVLDLFHQFFPPRLSLFWNHASLLWLSILDTLSMAFLATVCGGAIALVLAFLGASNTAPHPLVRLAVRTLLVMQRSIPALIIILVLLIEQADKGTSESVQSLGSTRIQTIRYAIIPQVMPSFVANLFYAFDNNLRAAIPLGVFGGGGIGFQLAFANGLLHYRDVMAYTIMIVVMITVMERVSDWVRRGIITQPTLNKR
jgi:phosphonate transport system permease protein